jgi:two-component system, cell cycle sensor histidine kinase and response regulator CckA
MADSSNSRPQADPARDPDEGFRTLVDALPDAILVHSQDRIVFVNPRCVRLLGAERPDQLLGRSIYELIHPNFHETIRRRIRDCYERGTANPPGEHILVSLDGSSIPTEATAIPITWRGSPAIEVVIRDISERKRVEKKLREYERVVEGMEDMIVVVDRDLRYVIANRAFLDYRRMEREEVIGHLVSEVLDKEVFKTVVRGKLVECLKGNIVKYELKYNYPKLGERDLCLSYFPIENEGVVSGAACLLRDVTERKQMEQVDREWHARLELAESAGLRIGLWDWDMAANTVIWSDESYRQFGFTRDTFSGRAEDAQKRIHPEDLPRVMEAIQNAIEGKEEFAAQYRLVRPDGSTRWIDAHGVVLGSSSSARMIGIGIDITARQALEQQLRQAQKMEAVGKLAGGIAHDFNNILMVIQSYTEMLQEKLPVHDVLRKNTEQVMKAADRGASLTRQMLAFSRKQILSPVVLDLNVVIDETAKMLRRLIGEDIDFLLDTAESLWATEADADQIVQVLMNLCVNARDAMPHGGTLTITTGNVTVEEGSVGGQEFVPPGDYVRLSVTDTGTGIGKEFQGRVFEPFFTTKEVGKGTGLGLSTVYGIVKQSGGYVWVDSEPGHGACFTIYLPRVEQAITLNLPAKVDVRSRGAETILVAEDEEALREAVCDYLSSLGYTVLVAESGEGALSAASQRGGKIDLLITDLVMPKMSGRELAQMMGSICANLKIIYMSGYTDDDVVLRHGIHDPGVTFLQKPFSLGNLARKVRETLGPIESLED